MSRLGRSLKSQLCIIIVIGLWLPCQVMAADISVFVGYADNVRPSSFFPTPWLGDPGILDVGHAAGLMFDAGAIRIDNNTGAALTVDNVTVDGFGNGASFSLWGSFVIPSGMKAILTQTSAEENFDTSDQFLPGHECCTPLGNGVAPFPKVHITIGGQTTTFGDSAHVLDTHGFDLGVLSADGTNESFQWRLIGTTGSQAAPQPLANDFDGDGSTDFNGDRKTDILWRHIITGEVFIWLLNGASAQSLSSLGQVTDLDWQIVGVGDFDGDGKTDILWRHIITGEVFIWLLNGASVQSLGSLGQVADLNWQIVKVGDFDGDGKTDILWRHALTGQVFIWLLNGLSVQSLGSPGTVADLGWRIVRVGDFNGDGKADILWRHALTGQVFIWLLNGVSGPSFGSPGTVADLGWQIQP